MFGCISSPAVANFCLRYSTQSTKAEKFSEDRAFINNNFYVDDGLISVATTDEAVKLISDSRQILSKYNINLHKILSNSVDVLKAFLSSDTAESYEIFGSEETFSHRTLGILWIPKEESFEMHANPPNRPFTRRGVVSVINSLYDPLSIATPVSLTGKLLQRQVLLPKKCSKSEVVNFGWNDELPSQFLESWETWKASLSSLSSLKIPRSFKPTNFISPKRELFVFGDASESVIGYVIYMRSEFNSDVYVSFETASSKVAPLAAISLPSLELCAAVSATQCASQLVVSELKIKPESVSYFTDSTIVLGYIMNQTKKFSRYITRRVEIIPKFSLICDWHYINTIENPADLASRPQTPDQLSKSCWLKGPEFLWQKDLPIWTTPQVLQLPEERVVKESLKTMSADTSIINQMYRKFSSFVKLVNTLEVVLKVGYLLDLARQRIGISLAPRNPNPSFDECKHVSIQLAQKDSFSSEMQSIDNSNLSDSSRISSLSPFIDNASLIRVGGRLENADIPFDVKFPILLDNKHPLSNLLIDFYHRATGHQGKHLTTGEIRRNGYHILSLKSIVKNFLSKCVLCKKLRGATSTQLMASLPVDRIEEVPPFTNTGLDVFGHFLVTDKKCTRRT